MDVVQRKEAGLRCNEKKGKKKLRSLCRGQKREAENTFGNFRKKTKARQKKKGGVRFSTQRVGEKKEKKVRAKKRSGTNISECTGRKKKRKKALFWDEKEGKGPRERLNPGDYEAKGESFLSDPAVKKNLEKENTSKHIREKGAGFCGHHEKKGKKKKGSYGFAVSGGQKKKKKKREKKASDMRRSQERKEVIAH